MASVGISIQKVGLVKRRGMTPWYSVDTPSLGATVPYTATKTTQMAMLPGMAIMWYLVQLLVTSAALPSTVRRTAPYIAEPQTQWPETNPSFCGPSWIQNRLPPM